MADLTLTAANVLRTAADTYPEEVSTFYLHVPSSATDPLAATNFARLCGA